MEDAMTVAELIEYLKTLKQDYKVLIEDNENLTEKCFIENINNTYWIY